VSPVDSPSVGAGDGGTRVPATSLAWPRRALVAALFIGLVVLMFRPTPHQLAHTLSPDIGDPALLTWVLSWDVHALVTAPLHVFDANIFWPYGQTLAYTDSMLVLAPAFGLFRLFGAGDVLAYNFVMLGLMLLALSGAYSLTRWLTGRTDAAIIAAIAFGFSAYTFGQIGHLALLLLGFFPIGFLLLFRLLEERTTGRAVLFGLMNVAFLLGALYYAAIWMVCVLTVVAGSLVARRLRPGPGLVGPLIVAGAISLLGLPFLWPYYSLDQTREFIPDPGLRAVDIVAPAPGSYLYGGLADAAEARTSAYEHVFFPGFGTLALGALGLAAVVLITSKRRRMRTTNPEPASEPVGVQTDRLLYLWLLLAAGAAAVVLSLGPDVGGITMPLAPIRDHVPGFTTVRVASRFAVPALLAVAVLAAVGFAALTRRWRRTATAVAATVVAGFFLLELSAPVRHVELPEDRATLAVYEALDRKPDGVVVELPVILPQAGRTEWAFVEAPRMVYATRDWNPRFNGYSGGLPVVTYLPQLGMLNSFPSPASLDTMQRLHIRYAVLHLGPFAGVDQYTKPDIDAIIGSLPRGAQVERHGKAWLVDLARAEYRARRPSARPRASVGDPAATTPQPRWPTP
jgi:hypothetical protein